MKLFDYQRYIQSIKKKLLKIAGLVSFILVICIIGIIVIRPYNTENSNRNNIVQKQGYEISFNNTLIGMVANEEDIGIVMSKAYEELSNDLGYRPKIEQAIEIIKKDCNNSEIKALDILSSQLKDQYMDSLDSIKTKSYRITVDGNSSVYLKTKEEVEQVLKTVQLNTIGEDQVVDVHVEPKDDGTNRFTIVNSLLFVDSDNQRNFITAASSNTDNLEADSNLASDDLEGLQNEEDRAQLFDVGFVETVTVDEIYVDESDISDIQSAVTALTSEKDQIYSYKIPTGDPPISNISAPNLSVYIKEIIQYSKIIPKEIQYQENPDKYEGSDTVIDEGRDGSCHMEVEVTVVNGIVTDSQLLTQEVTVEPEDMVISKGTKPLPREGLIGAFASPLVEYRLTSKFGLRWNRQHKGIDMSTDTGTDVMASLDGTVSFAGWYGDYGYLVIIDHGDGVFTKYGHNSKILVTVGQIVSQYEVIAKSGNTGHSTGPHVHFEIIFDGINVNPLDYMKQ